MKRLLLFWVGALLAAGCNVNDITLQKTGRTDTDPTKMSAAGKEMYLILKSTASFSAEGVPEDLITREATLCVERNADTVSLSVRYAWANTGWELGFSLPAGAEGEETVAEGLAVIWTDGGRKQAEYQGEFLVRADISDPAAIQLSVSGEIEEPFTLNIDEVAVLTQEVEKETGWVIVDQFFCGYDRFVNKTGQDITLTVMDGQDEETTYSWDIPADGEVSQATWMDVDAYPGLDNLHTIVVKYEGGDTAFTFGEAPFSPESREVKTSLHPAVFDGILAVLERNTCTYTITRKDLR